MNYKDENETNFGFKKVKFEDKKSLVNEIFSNVARNYDFMNDLMSAGIHRLWKNKLCRRLPNLSGQILDMAGGTGDITQKLAQNATISDVKPNITIADINYDMLKIGRDKLLDQGIIFGVKYICADAQNLPFKDESFDYYVIAFGIRNIARRDLALKEAFRVLKPQGKFLCLEFSNVENLYFRKLYQLYSFNIIPKIGKLIAENELAYQYLIESIVNFPNQNEFAWELKLTGFQNVKFINLTNGIVAIHEGYKI